MQTTPESHGELDSGSVTVQLAALKRGNSNAQEWIFARVLPEVLQLARKRIGSCPTRYHDEYEIALEVLEVLLLQANAFDQLRNRTDLSRLLNRLVEYKSIDAYRRMRRRQKIEVGESWFVLQQTKGVNAPRIREMDFPLEATQSIAIDLFDSLCQTIRSLNEDELQCRQILKLLAEGYRIPEISQMVGRGERSVYRLLDRIENLFLKSTDDSVE